MIEISATVPASRTDGFEPEGLLRKSNWIRSGSTGIQVWQNHLQPRSMQNKRQLISTVQWHEFTAKI